VGNEASIKAATVWVEKNIGPINILVTNAGVLQNPLRAHKLKQDDWEHY
jgi:NADP-dependent 3-hydroxy acid dehydrogenase YdfG